MKLAAGILFFCDGKALLTYRSHGVDHPLTWGIPGGTVDASGVDGEDQALEGAKREIVEELGSLPQFKVFDKVECQDENLKYIAYFAKITRKEKSKWKIKLNWENSEAKWFKINKLPEPLHPGMIQLIQKRPKLFPLPKKRKQFVYVNVPEVLYHGTSMSNLCGLVWDAIRPSGGISVHRTKTRTAVFLTDEIEGATAYSSGGDNSNPIVVIEIKAEKLQGFTLEPDYDDAGPAISTELGALSETLEVDIYVGMLLSDKLANKIEREVEHWEGNPCLEVVIHEGKQYLGAAPNVQIEVDDSLKQDLPELYDEMDWNEDGPHLTIRQYLCDGCVIGVDRIEKIWLNQQAIKQLRISPEKATDTQDVRTSYQLHGVKEALEAINQQRKIDGLEEAVDFFL